MTSRQFPAAMVLLTVSFSVFASGFGFVHGADVPATKVYLLNVSKGTLPNDTGTEKTKVTLLENHPQFSGKALQVDYAKGDSFGFKGGKIDNWKPYTTLRFDVFSPATHEVKASLNVFHRSTTNYKTRGVVPLRIKHGKNSIQVEIARITNVNGSSPDLDSVLKWFIAVEEGTSATLYFSDIWLEGPPAPVARAAAIAGIAGAMPAAGYRIKGKVGTFDVDLTVTPITEVAEAPAPVSVAGDPARLTRIKNAPPPKIEQPVLFNTPEADAILGALEVFPPNNPWNLVVNDWPLHPDSQRIVASIGSDKPLRCNADMGFVLVPPNQKKIDVAVGEFADESDPGPYPVPDNIPIEGWPAAFEREGEKVTLEDVQRDTLSKGGDRHAIVVDPINLTL